jgi:hypothetical protein
MLKIFGFKSEESAADSKNTAYCGYAWFELFTKYTLGEQITENEISRVCSEYRGEE